VAALRTIAQINERNEAFWKCEVIHMKQRITDDAVCKAAMISMEAEAARLPLYWRTTFEAVLRDAAGAKRHFLSHMGRDGRDARKPDVLQQQIIELVRRNPTLTERQLRDHLETNSRVPPIVDINDETISFTNPDGELREAKLSGLKDRLSRAKKAISR
jgi:hypothetical protein